MMADIAKRCRRFYPKDFTTAHFDDKKRHCQNA